MQAFHVSPWLKVEHAAFGTRRTFKSRPFPPFEALFARFRRVSGDQKTPSWTNQAWVTAQCVHSKANVFDHYFNRLHLIRNANVFHHYFIFSFLAAIRASSTLAGGLQSSTHLFL